MSQVEYKLKCNKFPSYKKKKKRFVLIGISFVLKQIAMNKKTFKRILHDLSFLLFKSLMCLLKVLLTKKIIHTNMKSFQFFFLLFIVYVDTIRRKFEKQKKIWLTFCIFECWKKCQMICINQSLLSRSRY